MCDEASNTAKCLFDGGDCCQENKDKALCRDCICVLDVKQEDLIKQFREMEIKPVEQQASANTAMGFEGGAVEVGEVVSAEVCSLVCLEHKKADELNAWLYNANGRICRCGWIESASCPRKVVLLNWSLEDNIDLTNTSGIEHHEAFVQLKKTIPCGMFRVGFMCERE